MRNSVQILCVSDFFCLCDDNFSVDPNLALCISYILTGIKCAVIVCNYSFHIEHNFLYGIGRRFARSYYINGRLEAATISDILYLFGQGNFTKVKEKSGNFEN